MNISLWIENVLNKKNVIAVYSGTGLPDDDGYLATTNGKTWSTTNGATATALYKYLEDATSNYSIPRTVRLGLQVNL
jgi:hypothetical protein